MRELDDFASRKLTAGYAPGTGNRMRETLRSALSTAVPAGPVDPQRRPLRRRGRRHPSARGPIHRPRAPGEACGLRWRDLDLASMPPRLTVVWQLDRWGDLVHPKTATSRRTIPLRAEVAAELEAWRHRQQQRTVDGVDNIHGLVFATRNGHPIDQRNVGRALHRARTAAGVDHGSPKTFRSTVATQLAEAGLHPSKTQTFLGHAHVTTTMTYYTAIDDVDEAADLLPDLR
jgi:integrase